MKKRIRMFGIIAIMAIIALSMTVLSLTGCSDGGGDPPCTHSWSGWSTTGNLTKTCQNAGCSATYSINDEMANIPAGSFVRDTHTITLSAFRMSKFQVTQELYEAVMGNNPSSFASNPAADEIQGKRPVDTVTWFDAVMFCNKLSEREGLILFYTITDITMHSNNINITAATVETNTSANGYRLPTEAQWEYACRAGSTTRWYFGDAESQLVNYAWYTVNSNFRTHQVGLKLPNEFGLYDMHGNVWEWCWDWWSTSFPDPDDLDNPTGPVDGSSRVRRGGAWNISVWNTMIRSFYNPNTRSGAHGFRLVCP